MFTCKWFDKLVDDHLAGRLGKLRTLAFRLHMTICPPCRKYLNDYQRTVDAAHQQKQDPSQPPPLETDQVETIARKMDENQTPAS